MIRGIARNSGGTYTYEYNLSDHLGNVRASFDIYGGAVRILQRDDYYAFGLRKAAVGGTNKYLYNGKELQEELEQYDYGARFYDPVIARWNVVDPLAEKYLSYSPYAYVVNNPLALIDPNGMEIIQIAGGVRFTEEDAVSAFNILTSRKKNAYMAIEDDDDKRKNMDRREKVDGNGQWAVFGAKDFKTASAAMDIFKAGSLDNFVLETHAGHNLDGSFLRVNDMSDADPNFRNPDNYIYNSEIADYLKGNGGSNAAEISQLGNMASKVRNGGNFIMAACVGDSNDSKDFARNMAKLTGNRMNIYFPKDYVHSGAYKDAPWKGTRSVNRILRVSNDAGWFGVSPSGATRNYRQIQLSQFGSIPALIK